MTAALTALQTGGTPSDAKLAWDPNTLSADLVLGGNDLAVDQGLHTAVVLSLFCDALAETDDVIPDGTDNRRGWWGDLQSAASGGGGAATDRLGSRLWLYRRSPATEETRLALIAAAEDALAWMTTAPTDGGLPIAGSVAVDATYVANDRVRMHIEIARSTARGAPVNRSFDFYWAAS